METNCKLNSKSWCAHLLVSMALLLLTSNHAIGADADDGEVITENVATVIVPIFAQRVSLQLPTDWHAVHEDNNDKSYLIEFIPVEQTLANWESMVSLQGFKGLATRVNGEQFLDHMFSSFNSACADHIIYKKLPNAPIAGYQAASAILGCANVPGGWVVGKDDAFGEIGYFLSIQGEEDVYLLHKSIRTDTFAVNDAPLNQANIEAYFADMMPIHLCKNVGEPWQCLP